jgi:pimeloyl-ACP methyl ester carboxylesterase
MNVQTQSTSAQETRFVSTKLGEIAVYTTYAEVSDSEKAPVIFLHGVYFDHHLWSNQVAAINDRTVFTIDMPWHGDSKKGVPEHWTLEDCDEMLIEILDRLDIPKVVAIGHSWGSMTILRAAAKYPERFASVGFCNMPLEAATAKQKHTFHLQHSALMFRNFYMNQTGKVLFGKETLQQAPELLDVLKTSMVKLSNKEIRLTDEYVILNAHDDAPLVKNLHVPALALKGKEDYVPATPTLQTTIVRGGHLSPIESPREVTEFCQSVIELAETGR